MDFEYLFYSNCYNNFQFLQRTENSEVWNIHRLLQSSSLVLQRVAMNFPAISSASPNETADKGIPYALLFED